MIIPFLDKKCSSPVKLKRREKIASCIFIVFLCVSYFVNLMWAWQAVRLLKRNRYPRINIHKVGDFKLKNLSVFYRRLLGDRGLKGKLKTSNFFRFGSVIEQNRANNNICESDVWLSWVTERNWTHLKIANCHPKLERSVFKFWMRNR